ncbi:MAG: hypothetical protein SXV54_20235 [Chloroflexota bacterium]|nr:hypothetical protein [Chloroflexota bacterium]
MVFLIQPQVEDPAVNTVTVTVRRSVENETAGWTTVEIQAEATISDPSQWREETGRLAAEVATLVVDRLKKQVACRLPCTQSHTRGNGKSGSGSDHPVNRFWRTVYAAGRTREEGQELVRETRGDFRRALALARARWNGGSQAE